MGNSTAAISSDDIDQITLTITQARALACESVGKLGYSADEAVHFDSCPCAKRYSNLMPLAEISFAHFTSSLRICAASAAGFPATASKPFAS